MLGILTGPVSGDLYLFGQISSPGTHSTFRRVDKQYNEKWSKVYTFELSYSGFEIDNSENFIYTTKVDNTQFQIMKFNASDGSVIVVLEENTVLMTGYHSTKITMDETGDILYFSADDHLSNFVCRWETSLTSISCANYTYQYASFVLSAIDRYNVYSGSITTDEDYLLLVNLDFTNHDLETWNTEIS